MKRRASRAICLVIADTIRYDTIRLETSATRSEEWIGVCTRCPWFGHWNQIHECLGTSQHCQDESDERQHTESQYLSTHSLSWIAYNMILSKIRWKTAMEIIKMILLLLLLAAQAELRLLFLAWQQLIAVNQSISASIRYDIAPLLWFSGNSVKRLQ